MVRVCDAIMGSGKTSATITYINEHPEKKFLYITPYLPEAARIKESCPDANFAEPSDKLPQHSFSKAVHTLALIEEGRNIASTHQAMMYYTTDTIRMLKEGGYTLIIDEEVTVMEKERYISINDIKIAEEAGYIYEVEPGQYQRTDKNYAGGKFSHMFRLMESRPLLCMRADKRTGDVYYWVYSDKLLKSMEDVILLTYLFQDSEMEIYFKMHDVPYEYIGVRRTEDGGYNFSDKPDYVPEYTKHIFDMIHIESGERINDIGQSRTALSMGWYKTNVDAKVEQLRKNIYTFFRSKEKLSGVDGRMCGTYKEHWGQIRSKGYWNSNVQFSQKSSNEFRHRTILAYPVNLFANANVVSYYSQVGYKFSNEWYALSIMLQWIWRSAIREGKEIWLYVPSKRMRNLLLSWMKEVSKCGNMQ